MQTATDPVDCLEAKRKRVYGQFRQAIQASSDVTCDADER